MTMMPYTDKFNIRIIDKLIVVMVGVLVGTVITTIGVVSVKWPLFLLVAIFSMLLFPIVSNKDNILLFGLFFLLPIGLNYNPVLLSSGGVYRPINGVVVYGYDVPLFILFIFLFWRLISKKDHKIDFIPQISIPFIIIIILGLIGVKQSLAPGVVRLWTIFTVIKCYFAFLIVYNSISSKSVVKLIFYVLLITIFLQAAVGIAQLITGGSLGLEFLGEAESSFETVAGTGDTVRLGGLMTKNSLAAYLSFIIPINIVLLFAGIRLRTKLLFVSPILILACILELLTYSRGAWLGLSVGATLTLYGCISRVTRRHVLSFFFVCFAIFMGIITVICASESVRDRLVEDDYGSAKVRIPLMINALNMIKENPVFGVGIGNYTSVSQQYDVYQWVSLVFPWPVHNDILLIGAEMGLPALASFLVIMVVLIYHLAKVAVFSNDDFLSFSAYALLGGVVAFGVHHLVAFTYVMLNSAFWSFAGMAYALVKLDSNNSRSLVV